MNNAAFVREPLLPCLDIALPLYAKATLPELEACHRAMVHGQDLNRAVAGRDEKWVKQAYQLSLRAEQLADRWLTMSAEELKQQALDGLDDFSLATFSQICFEADSPESNQRLLDRSNEVLLMCLLSPEANPLVNYDWMFSDFLEYSTGDNEQLHLELTHRALAHNLAHEEGKNVKPILSNLASDYLMMNRIKKGVGLFVELLQRYPGDFDVQREAAVCFSQAGFKTIGLRLAEVARSQSLLTGEYEHDAADLEMMVSYIPENYRKTREEDFIWRRLDATLRKPPVPPQQQETVTEFVHRVTPDAAEMPVKRLFDQWLH